MSDQSVAMCGITSEGLLVFLEAGEEVKRAASGYRLPAPLVAALREFDRLGHQLHDGAELYIAGTKESSLALTVLRVIANGVWNAGRPVEISAQEYAAESLRVMTL